MSDKGTRLPDTWEPSEVDRAYALKHGFGEREIDRIAEDFKDYWVTKCGAAARHRLWDRVWARWIRVEADRRPRGNVVKLESGYERQGREYQESLKRLRSA